MTWHPITESVPQHRQKVRCKLVFTITGREYVLPGHFYYNAHKQLFVVPEGQLGDDFGHISIDAWAGANELEAASKQEAESKGRSAWN